MKPLRALTLFCAAVAFALLITADEVCYRVACWWRGEPDGSREES